MEIDLKKMPFEVDESVVRDFADVGVITTEKMEILISEPDLTKRVEKLLRLVINNGRLAFDTLLDSMERTKKEAYELVIGTLTTTTDGMYFNYFYLSEIT